LTFRREGEEKQSFLRRRGNRERYENEPFLERKEKKTGEWIHGGWGAGRSFFLLWSSLGGNPSGRGSSFRGPQKRSPAGKCFKLEKGQRDVGVAATLVRGGKRN